MKLVAYVDESGTHSGAGSDVVIVGGYIAPREEWARFCRDWRHILTKFSAPYFHFREWYAASAVARKKRQANSGFKKNPFKTWDQSRLDEFLFQLAKVAASGNKLVIGGYVPSNLLHEDKLKGTVTVKEGPFELCVNHMFDSVTTTINRHRAPWKRQPVAFFFDRSDNTEWKSFVVRCFDWHRIKKPQFTELSFVNKTDHLPLQAADMVAYRLRQRLEKTINCDFSDSTWPALDDILFKTMDEWARNLTKKEKEEAFRRFFIVEEANTE